MERSDRTIRPETRDARRWRGSGPPGDAFTAGAEVRPRPRKSWLAALGGALVVGLVACAGSTSQGGPAGSSGSTASSEATAASSAVVPYCEMAGVTLTMDVFSPLSSRTPAPVAIMVHGGGWEAGDAGPPGRPNTVEAALQARGFFVASVNYRLAPQFRWPAQIEDVKCAVRYLRAHASGWHLDPGRIGAWGSSAGGHLVALLAMAPRSAGYDVGPYLDQSSAIQAVVDEWGPADLTAAGWGPAATQIIRQVFGDAPGQVTPALLHASPVTFVTGAAPPFLILQGADDTTVPPTQSEELNLRLVAAAAPSSLVIVQNAGHGLQPTGAGPITPPLTAVTQMIVSFFVQHLGR